jgi:hypothetical protein
MKWLKGALTGDEDVLLPEDKLASLPLGSREYLHLFPAQCKAVIHVGI